MYKILLVVVLLITGCSVQYSQSDSLSTAFREGCVVNSIESSLVNEGNKLILTATCTKDK